jgi:CheY-like chemotaxis protein
MTSFSDDSQPKETSEDFDYGTLFENSFNILVIDDEHLVARMLGRVLKKFATHIYLASSPSEARFVLQNHPVNFIICDYNLGAGVPSGVELITALRKEFSGVTHAVIFSGEDRDTIPPSAAADAVLQKNTDLDHLCDLIRRNTRVYRIFEP